MAYSPSKLFWFADHRYQSVCISKYFGCNCAGATFFVCVIALNFFTICLKIAHTTHFLGRYKPRYSYCDYNLRMLPLHLGYIVQKALAPLQQILAASVFVSLFGIFLLLLNSCLVCAAGTQVFENPVKDLRFKRSLCK